MKPTRTGSGSEGEDRNATQRQNIMGAHGTNQSRGRRIGPPPLLLRRRTDPDSSWMTDQLALRASVDREAGHTYNLRNRYPPARRLPLINDDCPQDLTTDNPIEIPLEVESHTTESRDIAHRHEIQGGEDLATELFEAGEKAADTCNPLEKLDIASSKKGIDKGAPAPEVTSPNISSPPDIDAENNQSCQISDQLESDDRTIDQHLVVPNLAEEIQIVSSHSDLHQSQSEARPDAPCPGASRHADRSRRAPHRLCTASRCRVRTGDHSISTDGVSSLLLKDHPLTSGPPTYFRYLQQMVETLDYNFTMNGNQLQIVSHYLPKQANGYAPPVEITANTIFVWPITPEPTNIILRKVTAPSVFQISQLAEGALTPYTQGQAISQRAVLNTIEPYFPRVGRGNLGPVCACMSDMTQRFDNSMIYAKLLWYSMVMEAATTSTTADTYQPWPVGPLHINVIMRNFGGAGAPPQEARVLVDDILSGHIIMREEFEASELDLDIIYLLSSDGPQYISPLGSVGLQAARVKWPVIPIIVWYDEPQNWAPPPFNLYTANRLRAFVSRLASERGEWDAAVKGLYLATEMMGLKYNTTSVEWRAIDASFSCAPFRMRIPRDYNVLHRMANLLPISDEDSYKEVMAFGALGSPQERTYTVGLYVYALRCFTTTFLQDYNVCTVDALNYMEGQAARGTSSAILEGKIFSCGGGALPHEATPRRFARMGFQAYMGVCVMHGLWRDDHWPAHPSLDPNNAEVYFTGMDGLLPPRDDTQLALDEFLLFRPLEWGLLGVNTTCNLEQEIMYRVPEDELGWYAQMGSSLYSERACSRDSYILVVYGIQAANLISQYSNWVDPQLQIQMRRRTTQGHTGWTLRMPYDDPTYNNALNIFEPGTIISYNWGNNNVMAPSMGGSPDGDLTIWQELRDISGRGVLQSVGFASSGRQAKYDDGLDCDPALACVEVVPTSREPPLDDAIAIAEEALKGHHTAPIDGHTPIIPVIPEGGGSIVEAPPIPINPDPDTKGSGNA